MGFSPYQQYVQMTKASNLPPDLNAISGKIVDAAFRVHTRLGPGLLESVYQGCLAYELERRRLHVRRQVIVPIVYDDLKFEEAFRLDLLVEDKVVVELKSVSSTGPLHTSQLLTYLKLTGHALGLLINFNTPKIKDGITRLIR